MYLVLTLSTFCILFSYSSLFPFFLTRCPAIGVPPPKLSFYKDGKLLPQNDNFIFDYDHGVLTIKRAAVDYAGQYVCVAENSAGASRMATKIELLGERTFMLLMLFI